MFDIRIILSFDNFTTKLKTMRLDTLGGFSAFCTRKTAFWNALFAFLNTNSLQKRLLL